MQRCAAYRRFTLVCLETRDARCTTHLRHFAPANGIPEDPVTGTAHAAIAVYLDRKGLLPPGERVGYLGEQGHAVGRPGMVTVEVHRDGGAIADVRIGGTGFIVARGEIEVPRAGGLTSFVIRELAQIVPTAFPEELSTVRVHQL